jgi:hypothetical protein
LRAMRQYSTFPRGPDNTIQASLRQPGWAGPRPTPARKAWLGWGRVVQCGLSSRLQIATAARGFSRSQERTHTHTLRRPLVWRSSFWADLQTKPHHHTHLALPHTACLFPTQAPPVVSASLFPTTLAKTLFSLCAHPPLPLPQTQGFALPIPSIFFSHGAPDHSVNIATPEHHQEPGRLPCSSTPGC